MQDKVEVFNDAAAMLQQLQFTIIDKDEKRPWGGFYVISEEQAAAFARHFFPGEDVDALKLSNRLSPKILLVAPNARLSWQYHHRRAEIWKCINGKVGVVTSDTDEEKTQHELNEGDIIKLKQGEWHRLVGLQSWGWVAEIWQHTDDNDPSNEDGIVRVQDDFGR